MNIYNMAIFNKIIERRLYMLKKWYFLGLVITSIPVYTMHDPCKDAKKYGVGAVMSSMITYGLWNKYKKISKENHQYGLVYKCGPVHQRKCNRLALFTCSTGV